MSTIADHPDATILRVAANVEAAARRADRADVENDDKVFEEATAEEAATCDRLVTMTPKTLDGAAPWSARPRRITGAGP